MASSAQDHAMLFLNALKELQEDSTLSNIQHAVMLGEDLLQALPSSSPLYPLCSCGLAACLLVKWQKTNAEENRDRELLTIIGSRVNAATKYCQSGDLRRAWYIKTQQSYYRIVRNFSARLEDDFWDHEHIETLNASMFEAKSAWRILRNNEAEVRHTAVNLGNLYMSRYLYFGRTGDLDDALKFSTIAVIMSTSIASKFQFQSYAQQAMRLSLWSLFDDQPDDMDNAIDYMNEVIRGRTWEVENRDVTSACGSSYAVALSFLSQIFYWVSIRRRRQVLYANKSLELSVSYSRGACMGMKEIDPGQLLSLNDSASAYLHLYLGTLAQNTLEAAISTAVCALDVSSALLTRDGIGRRYNGIKMSGHGGSLSSLVINDNRRSTPSQTSLKERRYQRWIVQAVEICADLLLTRYQRDHNENDLEIATMALKLCIQGTHAWSPGRPKMFFKLNQALHEKVIRMDGTDYGQVRNFLHRSPKIAASRVRLRDVECYTRHTACDRSLSFEPLTRKQCVMSELDMKPINNHSWQRIPPRGAYDHDMRLSTDSPNILTSDVTVSTEHLRGLICRRDPQIDCLLQKLDPNDSESAIVCTMWNEIYCSAGPSLKRTELYHRALLAFIKNDDLETACELADLAAPYSGNLELYLMEPNQYTSQLPQASALASTIACIWLKKGRDPWTAIRALENGKELTGRDGMNTVRSYGFEPKEELLPRVRIIHDQLQRTTRTNEARCAINVDYFTEKSKALIVLMKDLEYSEASMKPFDKVKCMSEARNGFIVHLISSTIGTYALITTSDAMQSLHLPQCTYSQLRIHAANLQKAIAACEKQEAHKGAANRVLRSILPWLWKTLAKPLLNFLRLSAQDPESSSLPSIHWIPCGVFSQLPVHAAGIYTPPSTNNLAHYAVSSYFPSIRTHLDSQSRQPLVSYYPAGDRAFTLIGMSTSPEVPEGSLTPLSVSTERSRILAQLGPSFPTSTSTIDNCNLGVVRTALHWARLVHFTCHGLPHPSDPSRSRLVLLNDAKEPASVAAIRRIDVPNAALLFLSACHSAANFGDEVTDEVTHLAKAFLQAGFPVVVGSLWKAWQASAMEIAAEFYGEVARGWGKEEGRELFPRALQTAVGRWRRKGNEWKAMDWGAWVCYL